MDTALVCEKPQVQYDERCYYYDVKDNNGIAKVGIYSVDANVGLVMSFDKAGLDCFTQWKMMGVNDYVMGLEPGNCNADGRDITRQKGLLKFLEPGESGVTKVKFSFTNDQTAFESNF
jgi:hypothetical protein